MNRKLILIVCLLLLFLIVFDKSGDRLESGEMVDDVEGVSVYVDPSTVTSRGGTLVFANDSDVSYDFGEDYGLEVLIHGRWYKVAYEADVSDGVAVTTEAYLLLKSDTNTWSVDWNWLYGDLEKGHYRILKGISILDNYKQHYLIAAEFVIE